MGYDLETIEGQREWHLNVTGMSLILALLDRRDVLEWADDDDGPADPDTEDEDDWLREWDANQVAWHAARGSTERIPAFKFRTNGEWLVFPQECRLIAAALRAATPADAAVVTGGYDAEISRHPNLSVEWGDDRVRDLLEGARGLADYAEAAAGLGGFRVK